MNKKTFGRTGTTVTEIGMGTYYDPMWIASATMRLKRGAGQKVAALKAGLDGGMNFIDTAEIYQSESLVAKAIKGYKRDKLFIATKVWPNHLGRDALVKALGDSLRRLELTYVDLYQIHWPNPRVPISETMGAMEELKRQGKVSNIGVSNFSLEQTVEASAALKESQLASNQVDYSLANRAIERDLLPYCEKEGIAIVAYYPLGHGKLALAGSGVSEVSSRLSKTPAQVALNWLASKPNVFPIPRASNAAHVGENLGASGWTIPEEERKRLEQIYEV